MLGCPINYFTVCNRPDVGKQAMKPAARIAAVIEILTEMRATSDVSRLHSRRAGQWLSSGFQRRRFAGSGDRAAIGDLFWKIQRASARLDWHLTCLDAPNSPRNMVLAALVLIERQVDELTQLFSADVEYAPSPIDTNEKNSFPRLRTAI